MLALENRVARLEEQVARLSAALTTRPPAPVAVPVDAGPAPVEDGYAEARALAAEGNKIHAIKVVRDQSGMSLKQAKNLVDSW
jgi:large subunit ribosomal protein L7/L12